MIPFSKVVAWISPSILNKMTDRVPFIRYLQERASVALLVDAQDARSVALQGTWEDILHAYKIIESGVRMDVYDGRSKTVDLTPPTLKHCPSTKPKAKEPTTLPPEGTDVGISQVSGGHAENKDIRESTHKVDNSSELDLFGNGLESESDCEEPEDADCIDFVEESKTENRSKNSGLPTLAVGRSTRSMSNSLAGLLTEVKSQIVSNTDTRPSCHTKPEAQPKTTVSLSSSSVKPVLPVVGTSTETNKHSNVLIITPIKHGKDILLQRENDQEVVVCSAAVVKLDHSSTPKNTKSKKVDLQLEQDHQNIDDCRPTSTIRELSIKLVDVKRLDHCKKNVGQLLLPQGGPPQTEPPFKCHKCKYVTLTNKRNLHDHIRRAHGERKYKCTLCERKFPFRKDLRKHLIRHKEMARRKAWKKAEATLQKSVFKCTLCEFVTTRSKYALTCHTRRKHGDRPYKCSICDRCYGVKRDLTKHVQLHNQDMHVCNKCGKKYKLRSSFKAHMQTHSVDYIKPVYKCGECVRFFCAKSTLDLHVNTVHKGMVLSKPHICSFCGLAFEHKYQMQRHQHLHTNTKPYKCPICNKAFRKAQVMKEHLAVHTTRARFVCQVCGKAFRHRPSFKRHSLVHSTECKYECDLCPKRFKLNFHLVRHRRIHTGERPYTCKICGSSFNDISILRKHLIHVHNSYQTTAPRYSTTTSDLVGQDNNCEENNRAVASIYNNDEIGNGELVIDLYN